MAQEYLVFKDIEKRKVIHIPFTPYFLIKDADFMIWLIFEKELCTTSDIYHFRKL